MTKSCSFVIKTCSRCCMVGLSFSKQGCTKDRMSGFHVSLYLVFMVTMRIEKKTTHTLSGASWLFTDGCFTGI